MKKRNLIKMIIIALILISILGAVMWYSKSINKLLLIENIKQAINEENNITTIDVTGIELGKETEHEHIYKTVYDEEKHWEECTACGEKNNISNHEYIDQGWIMGNSCDESNMHKFNCECGYNYKISEGRKTHNMIISNNFTSYAKEESCTNCTLHKKIHQCIKSDGTEINCMNLGTCAICGYTYSTSRAYHVLVISRDSNDIEEKEMFCSKCKINMGTLKYMRMIKESNTNYKFQVEIVVPDGAKYIQNPNFSTIGGNVSYNLVPNINGNVWSTELTININEYREFGGNIRVNLEGIYGGIQICWSFIDEITKLDTVPPVVSNIEIGGTSLTEWSKIKQIIVSGTEDYCNTVKIRILNDKENVVFSGETTVNNGNYSISCIPELEAVIEGRTFKVIVTDSCGNSTEQEFSISKIDAIPPEATSNAEVGGEWSKEKSFTAVASDYGIGNVQIAFNDVSDYSLATKNGTEYTREYKLVGDVYSPTKARVFYKDELNNISSQEITIDKLDNTAPTITCSRFENNKLIIEANDRHQSLGEGSGVIEYRFMTSESKLENPEITKENSTGVSSNEDMIIPDIVTAKYVYIVAEDNVGNVSEPYEVEVPHLDLRTEVNLSAANGKGGVDLDWTGYDPTNKVFKAYQKKEEAEEFESISTVDFYKEIEPIKVLNIYPEYKGDTYGDIPTVTFRYLDGTSVSLPKSAALKVWMEGGTMTEGSKTTNFEAYGKNPITGQQIIKVDLVGVSEFNTNPKVLRDYDVVVFGTWNGNGGINNLVNDAAIEEVEKYIKDGYGVLTGHDSIGLYYYGTGLSKLRKYFNIEVGIFENPPKDLSLIDQNVGWYYFSTKIKVDKVGLITNFPYVLPENAILTIPSTHTMSNAAKGNVWITLVNGTDYGNSKYSIKNYKGKGNPVYYLTTWNNTAMIQTGNSNCESTADERKVLANTLFYLKQRTTETAFTDNSAQDLKAPNAPAVSAVREGSKIKLSHNADDNGSEYKYYVEAYDIADQSLLLSKSNERTEVVTTGTKGYYYIIDDNSNYVEFDINDATYVEGDSSLINLSNNGKYIHMKAVDIAGNVSEETTIKLEVEIPELRLTSKVNLNGANGKGTVELDWSTFELEDMYYVVYRKEKSDTEWTKIVSIEDKLTVKKYIDNLGNDKTKPSMPTINITGNSAGNSIDISAAATDTGTNYVYYVECYDTITNKLIISSKNN